MNDKQKLLVVEMHQSGFKPCRIADKFHLPTLEIRQVLAEFDIYPTKGTPGSPKRGGKRPVIYTEKTHRYIFKRKFGVDYDEVLAAQGGLCAICGSPGGRKRLCGDHCHKAESEGVMHFRGLICDNCNVGLGRFKDNIETLKSAIRYLSQ